MITADSICLKMSRFIENYDPYGFRDACDFINDTIEEDIESMAGRYLDHFDSRQYRRDCYEELRMILEDLLNDIEEAEDVKMQNHFQELFNACADLLADFIEYERRYA